MSESTEKRPVESSHSRFIDLFDGLFYSIVFTIMYNQKKKHQIVTFEKLGPVGTKCLTFLLEKWLKWSIDYQNKSKAVFNVFK